MYGGVSVEGQKFSVDHYTGDNWYWPISRKGLIGTHKYDATHIHYTSLIKNH